MQKWSVLPNFPTAVPDGGTLMFYDTQPRQDDLLSEGLIGLARQPKSIPPKFFYDAYGSQLFDAICDLEEYYPTRTETAILRAHSADIAFALGDDVLLIELGSGSSQKVRWLLGDLRPAAYMPVDISREHLEVAARSLARDYPWLPIHAACIDYSHGMTIPAPVPHARKAAFFPGSTIGNFTPDEAEKFLAKLARVLGPGGKLLIGVDLVKDPALLHAAYNDARGITAAFNLNLLVRLNREHGADFDLAAFEHHAFYHAELSRIEMHLRSMRDQWVNLAGHRFHFKAGETLHTENSYKYTIEGFQALARRAGFASERVFLDPARLFSVHLFGVASAASSR